ncbi:hypothetical protein BOTBODRAFT_54642 [Botryobasidium botryosum FD-172 SS1]|uniref:RING-type domain-containing protein n=1 Tax=Botryobasidium botryosum (strain FD-172 SS1) TaxID=930990 RepID=A0A067MU41_BOTB1|nr:hypothetical protein BOTBODRAFT_54642 [Botryobasidium botryosum FD-172 SS1]
MIIKLSRGKKRAASPSSSHQDLDTPGAGSSTSSTLSPPPQAFPEHPPKKSKKGQTRPCPVCNENIPLRLLPAHEYLELQRLEEITNKCPPEDEPQPEYEPSTSRRGAAVRARRSLTALSSTPRSAPSDIIDEAQRTIGLLKRNRRGRHAALKEHARAALGELESVGAARTTSREACPVCQELVDGSMDEHVDWCLQTAGTNASAVVDDGTWGAEYEVGGEMRIRVTALTGFQGMGFDIRDGTQADIDDELDIDGDDEETFGDAQFGEADIVRPEEDVEVQIDDDDDDNNDPTGSAEPNGTSRSLRDLVAQGNRGRINASGANGSSAALEQALGIAKTSGNKDEIIAALSQKVKHLESQHTSGSTSAVCRICLEPYTDPLCSIACWHVFCNQCWLRCLGSTKLCPVCKHISSASSLRRVYF